MEDFALPPQQSGLDRGAPAKAPEERCEALTSEGVGAGNFAGNFAAKGSINRQYSPDNQ